jgi:hypothetical protein
MIEMIIDSLRSSMMGYQRVVILKEKEEQRYLPIWIGSAEADAIAVKLQNVVAPRPLTHDLVCNVLNALGANVSFVVVNDLRDDTFYARITLNVGGRELGLDSRPSDAIAIAVRAGAPIYVEESILDRAGIIIDQETGRPIPANSQVGKHHKEGKVSEEELKGLAAFSDFINTLDLKDFDKGKGGS